MDAMDAQQILTVNGGSSSIKFALFRSDSSLQRILTGLIEGVGRPQGQMHIRAAGGGADSSRAVAVPDHQHAVALLMDWAQQLPAGGLEAVGHRVVFGGDRYWEPQRITPQMIDALRELSPFDPEHLPEEILLTEAFQSRFPDLTQIACFDTAFHHDMPRVARLLPIPRHYQVNGVQRYGFHGLSYAYLLQELERSAGLQVANGRIILAHLGNGASMAAVRERRSLETSMGFTPAAGLMMSTRSGDLDPGLMTYLLREQQMSATQLDRMVNHESGLLGLSERSADMRDLLSQEASDVRCAEAVTLFCYQARKWLGALATVLGGIDTLVFAGGIGENAAPVRARICEGLGFLGIELDAGRNAAGAELISTAASRVSVRVMRTDEELMIARSVRRILHPDH